MSKEINAQTKVAPNSQKRATTTSTLSDDELYLIRKGSGANRILAVLNFTPVPRYNYCVDVPFARVWQEILNSDAAEYGGSGVGNMGQVESTPIALRGPRQSLLLTLPPPGALFFKPVKVPVEAHD